MPKAFLTCQPFGGAETKEVGAQKPLRTEGRPRRLRQHEANYTLPSIPGSTETYAKVHKNELGRTAPCCPPTTPFVAPISRLLRQAGDTVVEFSKRPHSTGRNLCPSYCLKLFT
ncbi:hypothetical protein O3G_MSEX000698 [Manduca sexta]|nr:hypothetical protein O3G_MSEX000698 [Manduca sexta]